MYRVVLTYRKSGNKAVVGMYDTLNEARRIKRLVTVRRVTHASVKKV